MRTRKRLVGMALMLLIPVAAHAQQNLTAFNPTLRNKVLARSDVKASFDSIRKLDLSRLQIARGLGFADGAMCVTPMPIAAPDVDMHRSLFTMRRPWARVTSACGAHCKSWRTT